MRCDHTQSRGATWGATWHFGFHFGPAPKSKSRPKWPRVTALFNHRSDALTRQALTVCVRLTPPAQSHNPSWLASGLPPPPTHTPVALNLESSASWFASVAARRWQNGLLSPAQLQYVGEAHTAMRGRILLIALAASLVITPAAPDAAQLEKLRLRVADVTSRQAWKESRIFPASLLAKVGAKGQGQAKGRGLF